MHAGTQGHLVAQRAKLGCLERVLLARPVQLVHLLSNEWWKRQRTNKYPLAHLSSLRSMDSRGIETNRREQECTRERSGSRAADMRDTESGRTRRILAYRSSLSSADRV
jgi:hypothetical protein